MVANAGTIEAHDDSTFIAHFEYAKNPATTGTKGIPSTRRVVGDTLWVTFTRRWDKDTTKVVRNTTKYVRLK